MSTEPTVNVMHETGATASQALTELDSRPLKYSEADAAQQELIDGLMQQIDINNSQSILLFGSKAQLQLGGISESMLDGVRDNDLGATGQSLSDIVTVLRSFDLDIIEQTPQPGFFKRLWTRLFGRTAVVSNFFQQYEKTRRQIDTITDKLEKDKTGLLRNVATLDKLFDKNIDYFQQLELYISAAQEQLRLIETDSLPALQQTARATRGVVEDQQLRDLRSARTDLKQRIQDLELTRMVSLQAIPGIRIVQHNDRQLIDKINATLANTIPLWRQQLSEAVNMYRSMIEGSEATRAIASGQGQLSENNAKLQHRQTVQQANQVLLASLEEGLQLVSEGQHHQRETEAALINLDNAVRAGAPARSIGTG